MINNIPQWAGIAAGVFAIGGYIPYILAIIRGTTRPNRATWLIWGMVGGLLAFSYMASGSREAIWLPLGYFLGPATVGILSIRYGYVLWSRFDSFCVVLALLSVIPWMLSKDATITLLINVFIDAVGAIPTLIKSYKDPESEDFLAWFIFLIANTLQFFAIQVWDLSSIYPIYLFFLALFITYFTFINKVKKFCISRN